MYKIIACDMDETLLNKQSQISEKNLEYIRYATALGVKFVIATGRGYTSIQNDLKTLGLFDKENEYTISFNGGLVTENKNNKFLHFEGISWETANFIYQFGQKYDVCVHAYTKDNPYILDITQDEYNYLGNKMGYINTSEKTLDFLKGQDMVKCVFVNTNRDYLQQLEKDIRPYLNDVDITYSSNRYIEFNKAGVNKGSGLTYLAKLLNIDIKDTIAIGDNFNDLSMIQAAGLGVGVKNTVEVMKPMCDYITEADHDHDAIAEVIDKFIL